MTRNKVYTVKFDNNLQEVLDDFVRSMSSKETITSTSVAGNKIVIVTEIEMPSKPNLLLEQMRDGGRR